MRCTVFSRCAILLYVALQRFSVRAGTSHSQGAHSSESHLWQSLTNKSLLSLCKLGDYKRFSRFLEPILVPRIVDTESHKAVGQYLATTLKNLGFTVSWDRFSDRTPHGQKSFANIIATFDPKAPKRLVLACHYDSKVIDGITFIGAIDSAAPCAMLLDIASSLAALLASQKDKTYTLQLIFFDGEEAFGDWTSTNSIFGARHLASVWKKRYTTSTHDSTFNIRNEMDKIALFVLLDLLGAPNPKMYNFGNYRSTGAFNELMKIESRLHDLDCLHHLPSMFDGRAVYVEVEDDHLPFARYGLPVLHLIPVPFPGVWHTADDNAAVLHPKTIENLLAIFRVFVAKFLGLNT